MLCLIVSKITSYVCCSTLDPHTARSVAAMHTSSASAVMCAAVSPSSPPCTVDWCCVGSSLCQACRQPASRCCCCDCVPPGIAILQSSTHSSTHILLSFSQLHQQMESTSTKSAPDQHGSTASPSLSLVQSCLSAVNLAESAGDSISASDRVRIYVATAIELQRQCNPVADTMAVYYLTCAMRAWTAAPGAVVRVSLYSLQTHVCLLFVCLRRPSIVFLVALQC